MAKDRVGTLFEGDASDLLQEVRKIRTAVQGLEGSYKGVTRETQKLTKEEKAFGRETKRALDEIRGPQQRYEQRTRALHALLQKKKITQREFNTALRRTKEGYQTAGRAGQQAFGPQALGQLKGMLGGFLSISAVVATAGRSFGVWLQNIKEIAAEANKASGEIIAFAALQEGGKKAERVMAVSRVAQKYGITERGVAYDTVQAMQSALGGDFQAGLKASREVFAATLTGIKLEDAKEVATLAAAGGRDPATALRRVHVAGEASARSPRELAKGAAGLKYWQDPEVGWAAAATLAGAGRAEELRTYLKRGGMALSRAPSPIQKKFEGLGLGEAGQLQRLEFLAREGVTTPEAAGRFGFTEVRAKEAVSDLVARLPELKEALAVIRAEAKPGLFQRERAEIEAEIPITRWQRLQQTLATKLKDRLAFGGAGERAQKREAQRQMLGLALRNTGQEQFLAFDMLDEEGKIGAAGFAGVTAKATYAQLTGTGGVGKVRLLAELVAVHRETAADMKEAVGAMKDSAAATQQPVVVAE